MNRKIFAKNAEWLALIALFMVFAFGVLVFVIAHVTNSHAAYIEGWHFIGGGFIWLLALLHIRQRRLFQEEEELAPITEHNDTSLFKDPEQDPFSAKSRLKFFEKWIVPITTLILGLIFFIGGIILVIGYAQLGRTAKIVNGPLAAAFLSGFAFFSLLVSKYALGMARQQIWRLLRAGGSYLFMNACSCFLCAIAVICSYLEIDYVDRYLAITISLLLAIIGFEMLLNLLLDIYRPRVTGQELHYPYDSRFLNLCTGSKGLLRTAAHTLDYQFGFKVSETWFYQFLERTISPLLLFLLLSLYLMNCIIVVRPYEQAVVERFGRPLSQVLAPGLHIKWPWPAETAYNYPTGKLHTIFVGLGEDHGHAAESEEYNYLFKAKHTHEINFLMAHKSKDKVTYREQDVKTVPVSLLSLAIPINYRIKNLLHYVAHGNPKDLLRGIGYREVTLFFASASLEDAMGSGRLKSAQILRKRIQEQCDKLQPPLGIEIVFLGISGAHPPVPVVDEFVAVIGAMEEEKTKILQAETELKKTLPRAKANAAKLLIAAESYKYQKQKLTAAEAKAFADFLAAYKQGGNIYLERKYLKILEKHLPGKRLYLINAPATTEITSIDLKEPLGGAKLWNLDYSEKKGEGQ